MIKPVLDAFGFESNTCSVQTISNGLINSTWLINNNGKRYILQRINTSIFKSPMEMSKNIRGISNYLKVHKPEYLFAQPRASITGVDIVNHQGGYYRAFDYVENSVTINVATSPQQAYEAAQQFALFTKALADYPADQLHIALPDFHNLRLRYLQFEQAIKKGSSERLRQSYAEIQLIRKHYFLVEHYIRITESSHFKLRVTHHDTKISNVLFNHQGKGLCVIDLDTVMPGYFISDVGDMIRTYISPVSEENQDLTKVFIRNDYFEAIADGYLEVMQHDFSDEEKNSFLYSGYFIIYMQAIRFLTDYLNNDIYYGAAYEGHNLIRAKNQLTLLKHLMEKEYELKVLIKG